MISLSLSWQQYLKNAVALNNQQQQSAMALKYENKAGQVVALPLCEFPRQLSLLY